TINSAANPATPGSIVSIFATGLGPVSPTPGDGAMVGLPAPVNVVPVKIGVTIGGIIFSNVPEDPRYAGPAPFQVAGVSRIDFAASASPMFVAVGEDFYRDSVRS